MIDDWNVCRSQSCSDLVEGRGALEFFPAMASLRAVSARLSPWLTVTLLRNDSCALRIRKPTCVKSQACFTSDFQSRLSLHTVRKCRALIRRRQCQLCQNRPWSSVAANVPQLDLVSDAEKTQRSSVPLVDASEILLNLSPEEARRLKIIKLEFDVMEQMHGMVRIFI